MLGVLAGEWDSSHSDGQYRPEWCNSKPAERRIANESGMRNLKMRSHGGNSNQEGAFCRCIPSVRHALGEAAPRLGSVEWPRARRG